MLLNSYLLVVECHSLHVILIRINVRYNSYNEFPLLSSKMLLTCQTVSMTHLIGRTFIALEVITFL